MKKILDNINNVDDLRKLNLKEKKQLSNEIRQFILHTVSKTGGHLASNLGVVELTIALHSIFNTPQDKIVWDVGHQTYVHKILTGRKKEFSTLRKLNGLSGFPKTNESEFDTFNTGHSSTSISVGLGMARTHQILNKNSKVVVVLGDGAITGGMALEALDNAGHSNTDITVILNDNQMSISKNVGGITDLLTSLRTKKLYTNSNKRIKRAIKKIPKIGPKIALSIRKIKNTFKQLFISNMFFEDIGFTYLGPVDGHDIEKLENILKDSKNLTGPVLIHVITKKGKGYRIAENNPDKFHSISPFNITTGEKISKSKKDYSSVFGDKLVSLAKKNDKIVAITAAMCQGTGLEEFSKTYPNRFFDVGIAEQHALGLAAGMASQGLKPVVTIYSSFLQRGYDQLIHDICIQNLPVTICVDRAGLVGNDGETHQGLFDLAFSNIIPNLTILSPKDFIELEQMLEFSINLNKPVLIRYPRGCQSSLEFRNHDVLQYGKGELINQGQDITIIAIGKMVSRAIEVSNLLKTHNITLDIINVRFLKPIDEELIISSINKTKRVVTIEDGVIIGGLSYEVLNIINKHKINDVQLLQFGYPDKFIEHGNVDELEKIYKLDANSISKEILEEFLNK